MRYQIIWPEFTTRPKTWQTTTNEVGQIHQKFDIHADSWKPLPEVSEGLGELSAANKYSLANGHTCGTAAVCACESILLHLSLCLSVCARLCVCVWDWQSVRLEDRMTDDYHTLLGQVKLQALIMRLKRKGFQ